MSSKNGGDQLAIWEQLKKFFEWVLKMMRLANLKKSIKLFYEFN